MNATKKDLLDQGIQLMDAFCTRNNIPAPPVKVYDRADWRVGACAYYRPIQIHISPGHCSHIGTANRAWSYPGYITDRTPYGVIAHELGHHIDHQLSGSKGSYGGDFSVMLRARTKEAKLTSYCPNDWEWFAEMFRLFITNPDLLRLYRRKTWEELYARFEPVETRPWDQVLAHAPQRTIDMAAKKISLLTN